MNVEMIGNHKSNTASDIDTNIYGKESSANSRMRTQELGYSLDITGKVKENAAYGKEDLKSAEEVMLSAGMQDVTLQRNYMAVMSNSMSDEDLQALYEDGVNPLDTEVSESVTNLDKIKLAMAQAGEVIAGYNDDIPANFDNIEGIREAMSIADNLKPMSDETLTYMLEEGLEPTIENIYKAEYSSAASAYSDHGVRYGGAVTYAGNNLEDADWEGIKEQALAIVKEAGYQNEEEGLEDARWIVSHDLPLTSENLESYRELRSVILPVGREELISSISVAIEEGLPPVKGNLLKTESIYDKAVRIKDLFDNMSDGGDLVKHRQLEEIRLSMTCEANLELLRKGISIETQPLEELVEELKKAERDFYRPLLSGVAEEENHGTSEDVALDEKITLYKDTVRIIQDIPNLPVRAIAQAQESDDFTLAAVESKGSELKASYDKAGQAYEAIMTSPRADMGDSIRKAFRNVDDILEDLDFELNDVNRKAVRTLGYAGMMINRENIENVRSATTAVSRVISMMTPAKTLSMIREGHNPLSENIYELEEELSREDISKTSEKYSRFLWKLEKNGQITQSEKDAFIGMYRLFAKIEKQDGKVIGNVLSNGRELTLENMLEAARSNRHQNKEYTIDDDFGLLEELVTKGESISRQIESGFLQMINEKPQKDYLEEKIRSIRAASKNSDEAREILGMLNEPVTVENIAAVSDMTSGMGKSFKRLFGGNSGRKSSSDREELKDEDAQELLSDFTDRESAGKAYETFVFKAERIARERILQSESYEDVRNYSMLYKQIGFAGSLGKGQSYEVPIYTKEGWTSVHLSFKSSEGSTPNVTATFSCEEYGRVKGSFTIKTDGVDGFIVSDSRDGVDNLKSMEGKIKEEFTNSNLETSNLSFVFSRNAEEEKYFDNSKNADVSNERLYSVAKAFIKAMSAER